MKIPSLLFLAVPLAACASTPHGPTPLADAAEAGMWSSKTPEAVRSCIAEVQAKAAPERVGQPLRFEVDAADPKKTRYKTMVSVFGDVSSNMSEAAAAASCL